MATGKVTLEMTNPTDGSKITENLGFVTFNAMDASQKTNAEAIQTFAGGISELTTNTYSKTVITYEVDLDTLE